MRCSSTSHVAIDDDLVRRARRLVNDKNAQLGHAVILAYEQSVLWHSESEAAHELHRQREGQLRLFIVAAEMEQLRERSAALIRKSDRLNHRIDLYFDSYRKLPYPF